MHHANNVTPAEPESPSYATLLKERDAILARHAKLLAALEPVLTATRRGPEQVIGFEAHGQRQKDFEKGWNAAKDQVWAALELAHAAFTDAAVTAPEPTPEPL